ncbi:fumarylacetoacetase [soil metagenome]
MSTERVMDQLNATHSPDLQSWVTGANDPDTDFPIQNLPFARFRLSENGRLPRIGVAIGNQVFDLSRSGLVGDVGMNELMAWGAGELSNLREALSAGLRERSPEEAIWRPWLVPMSQAIYDVPCDIGDYTDFYTGIHHATSVGRLFRPEQPLMPNYKWVPIGYHGRTSTIRVSGHKVRRPCGQTFAAGSPEPIVGPSKRLDFELELGYYVGRGNGEGDPIALDDAEDHLFGVGLLNDWSARDVQAWEYQPLGPFLAKNFATTVSPWIVTTEALAPFRTALQRPDGDPQPLDYLRSSRDARMGGMDIELQVWLQTAQMRAERDDPVRISHSLASQAAYWSAAQLVTHHTMNGCKLRPGDLMGSGTLSGPGKDEAGSLLEITSGGKEPLILPNLERRTFLEDGDTVTFRAHCVRAGARTIGFGEVTATVSGPASIGRPLNSPRN